LHTGRTDRLIAKKVLIAICAVTAVIISALTFYMSGLYARHHLEMTFVRARSADTATAGDPKVFWDVAVFNGGNRNETLVGMNVVSWDAKEPDEPPIGLWEVPGMPMVIKPQETKGFSVPIWPQGSNYRLGLQTLALDASGRPFGATFNVGDDTWNTKRRYNLLRDVEERPVFEKQTP
jgi:hypothetical protein